MIPLRLVVQEHQDLMIVCISSHHQCSLEGDLVILFVFWMNLILPCPILEIFWSSLRSGSWTGGDGAWVELSGKMHVLARLLAQLRQKTDDRIVLVSNYTQVPSFKLKWPVLQLKKWWYEYFSLISDILISSEEEVSIFSSNFILQLLVKEISRYRKAMIWFSVLCLPYFYRLSLRNSYL